MDSGKGCKQHLYGVKFGKRDPKWDIKYSPACFGKYYFENTKISGK